MKPRTFIQTRYMQALRLKAHTNLEADYIQGRMTGVCYVASKQGYAGDDLSIRLKLLGEVLAAR